MDLLFFYAQYNTLQSLDPKTQVFHVSPQGRAWFQESPLSRINIRLKNLVMSCAKTCDCRGFLRYDVPKALMSNVCIWWTSSMIHSIWQQKSMSLWLWNPFFFGGAVNFESHFSFSCLYVNWQQLTTIGIIPIWIFQLTPPYQPARYRKSKINKDGN